MWSDTYTENKGFCEDLTEGKFSFPIIHSIRSNPNNMQLLNILRQKSSDDAVKLFAKNYMESTGSSRYCRERVSDLIYTAREMMHEFNADLGKSIGVEEIINYLDFE